MYFIRTRPNWLSHWHRVSEKKNRPKSLGFPWTRAVPMREPLRLITEKIQMILLIMTRPFNVSKCDHLSVPVTTALRERTTNYDFRLLEQNAKWSKQLRVRSTGQVSNFSNSILYNLLSYIKTSSSRIVRTRARRWRFSSIMNGVIYFIYKILNSTQSKSNMNLILALIEIYNK